MALVSSILCHPVPLANVGSLIDVTMIQRGPTYIMSTKEGMPRLLGGIHSFDLHSLSDQFSTLKDFTGRVAPQLMSLIE